MSGSPPQVPHFLRVVRALTKVTGRALPVAMVASATVSLGACGGSVSGAGGAGGHVYGTVVMSGDTGTGGQPMGVVTMAGGGGAGGQVMGSVVMFDAGADAPK